MKAMEEKGCSQRSGALMDVVTFATCLHLMDGHGRRDGDFYKVVQRLAHLDSVNLAQGRPGEGLMTVPEVS